MDKTKMKKLLKYIKRNKKITEKVIELSPYKWVTFTSNHNTTYLEPNCTYVVLKEGDGWYYFKFGEKIIRYPKFYFEDFTFFSSEE